MYKLLNCWNLMKKTEKYRIMSKKIDFWPNLHETSGCHRNVKNDGHTIDISKFLVHEGWMNSYWKFQPLRVNRLFKILKKTLLRGWHPSPPPPLSVRGLTDIALIELPLPQIIFKYIINDINIAITLINWFYNI